jgi:hypothetical protein
MIPSVSHGGLFQIDTGSQDSIDNINGYFEFLKLTIGRIANIPLKLRRVPHLSPYQGQMQTHYPLVLRYEGSPELTEQLKQETTEVLAKLTTLDVQEALDVNPATDSEATIVAEEDLVTVMTLPSTPQNTPHAARPTSTAPQAAAEFASPAVKPDKTPQPMSAKQRSFLYELASKKGLSHAHVDAVTRGYNKRQASGLIEQLQTGDYSGLEEVSDEDILVTTTDNTVTPAPHDSNTPHVEF